MKNFYRFIELAKSKDEYSSEIINPQWVEEKNFAENEFLIKPNLDKDDDSTMLKIFLELYYQKQQFLEINQNPVVLNRLINSSFSGQSKSSFSFDEFEELCKIYQQIWGDEILQKNPVVIETLDYNKLNLNCFPKEWIQAKHHQQDSQLSAKTHQSALSQFAQQDLSSSLQEQEASYHRKIVLEQNPSYRLHRFIADNKIKLQESRDHLIYQPSQLSTNTQLAVDHNQATKIDYKKTSSLKQETHQSEGEDLTPRNSINFSISQFKDSQDKKQRN